MRQKADKLEKGKWYADMEDDIGLDTFLRYDKSVEDGLDFSEYKGRETYKSFGGIISFPLLDPDEFFTPTQEDREKYNLIDDE